MNTDNEMDPNTNDTTTTTALLNVFGISPPTTSEFYQGSIIMWNNDKPPPGWYICNGESYNGIQTPDLSGRFIMGSGQYNDSTNYTLGQTGGAETITLLAAQMPKHSHTISYSRQNSETDDEKERYRITKLITGNQYGSSSTGGGEPHENRPPYYVLSYIMFCGYGDPNQDANFSADAPATDAASADAAKIAQAAATAAQQYNEAQAAAAQAAKLRRTQSDIQIAVNEWTTDPNTAADKYGDISEWDTGDVTDMSNLFLDKSSFNDNINNWNTSNVTTMNRMFQGASVFNQPIGNWNVSKVTNMTGMFSSATVFDQPIGSWDVSNVTTMNSMFTRASSFNQNISSWDVNNVSSTSRQNIFLNCPISSSNKPTFPIYPLSITQANIQTAVNEWTTDRTLATTKYGDISEWDTSAVNDMNNLFKNKSSFNDNINNWNTSNVTNMSGMFQGATVFNQPIGNWNVSNVGGMGNMFNGATAFDQPIGKWTTARVTSMYYMFVNAAAFDQPIGNWEVSKVANMYAMFQGATSFNQNLSGWNFGSLSNNPAPYFGWAYSGMSKSNIPPQYPT